MTKDHEAENSMCACPSCIDEGWADQVTKLLEPWQEAAWDLIANLPPVPDGKKRIWYYNRKGQYVYADVEPQEQNMSDGKKKWAEDQDVCHDIIEEHGLGWGDLTLEERRYYRDANPYKLRVALSRREPQHFEYEAQLAEDDIPEDAVEYWVADVDEAAQETIMQAQNIQFFEELPDNAVLFWENGDLAFYHTLNGSVYVTESQSDEEPSDPVTEWESDYEVDEQTREEALAMQAAVNIFNFLIEGLKAARDNIERKL